MRKREAVEPREEDLEADKVENLEGHDLLAVIGKASEGSSGV